MRFRRLLFFVTVLFAWVAPVGLRAADVAGEQIFPIALDAYGDATVSPALDKILGRARQDPLNVVASLIFLLAIIHTFLASRFMAIAHRYEHLLDGLLARTEDGIDPETAARYDRLRFRAQFFHFMGEVEAVFGIWLVPLLLALAGVKGWAAMIAYVSHTSFAEPIFVVIIMAIAASRPILRLTEIFLGWFAALGRGTPAAWWLTILTVGPLLGSFITEPAAMTICALLLRDRFYDLKPGPTLRYATLGLLFVNISIGGTLTHFAAPPVVMVAAKWGWGWTEMTRLFGWKAAVAILTSNAAYFTWFRRELAALSAAGPSFFPAPERIPLGITIAHLLFISWTVATAHYSALVVLGFLFFLAFSEATERHQSPLQLRTPVLVGFFLAALVLHGNSQGWWIGPVLNGLTRWPLMFGATALTAVNDNAAITYLASLVPGFSAELKHAVMAGAVTGGGLTVIANAPNPAGQSILSGSFGEDGISPLKLLLAALIPTLIAGAALMLLP